MYHVFGTLHTTTTTTTTTILSKNPSLHYNIPDVFDADGIFKKWMDVTLIVTANREILRSQTFSRIYSHMVPISRSDNQYIQHI